MVFVSYITKNVKRTQSLSIGWSRDVVSAHEAPVEKVTLGMSMAAI